MEFLGFALVIIGVALLCTGLELLPGRVSAYSDVRIPQDKSSATDHNPDDRFFVPTEIRPDVSTELAVDHADEPVLNIGQPRLV